MGSDGFEIPLAGSVTIQVLGTTASTKMAACC